MLAAPIPDNESARIASLRRMLLLSTPDEEAFDRVTRIAQRLFQVPIALVSLIDAHRQWFKSCIGLPVRETSREISFCGHAIMANDLFVIEDATLDPAFADNPLVTDAPHVTFYAGRPLRNAEGFMIGTLCIIDNQPRRFSQDERRALDDLGYWIEAVLRERELSEAEKNMLIELDDARRTSMLDPMLNIWNRSAIMPLLEREGMRSFRNKGALAVMMIDIDAFRQINDEFGHPAGDSVLIEVTKRMLSSIRKYDSLGRYGGDEFIAVLPEADVATASDIARRVLHAISHPFLVNGSVLEVSVSIGIALTDFVSETPNMNELISRAEQALLTAKQQGKNQLVVFAG